VKPVFDRAVQFASQDFHQSDVHQQLGHPMLSLENEEIEYGHRDKIM